MCFGDYFLSKMDTDSVHPVNEGGIFLHGNPTGHVAKRDLIGQRKRSTCLFVKGGYSFPWYNGDIHKCGSRGPSKRGREGERLYIIFHFITVNTRTHAHAHTHTT